MDRSATPLLVNRDHARLARSGMLCIISLTIIACHGGMSLRVDADEPRDGSARDMPPLGVRDLVQRDQLLELSEAASDASSMASDSDAGANIGEASDASFERISDSRPGA